MRKRNYRILGAACSLSLFLFLAGCHHQAGFYVEQQEGQEEVSEDDSKEAEAALGPEEGSEKESSHEEAVKEIQTVPEFVYIQVCGAVEAPGVYRLPAGSRIFEAVEMAGGITEEGDVASVNQAQVLTDGQQIYICQEGEAEKPQAGAQTQETEDGRVNINTASREELMTLSGVGQSKADAIISWREKNGMFARIEDIMNIEGIKEGVFGKIQDRIKVD